MRARAAASAERRAAAEALLLRLLHLCLLLVLPPEAVLPRRWRRGGREATAPPAGGTTTRVGPGSPLPLRGPELAASTHQASIRALRPTAWVYMEMGTSMSMSIGRGGRGYRKMRSSAPDYSSSN
ncbi:uncharacterized protein [Miscanthus floridulus]|uniref:uncharacterized protein n=1 Tax=Miscanthus floridulus TaxID=154761 RepID=UPI0034597CCA